MRLIPLVLTVGLVSAASSVLAAPISGLQVFGDSLSDTGNLFGLAAGAGRQITFPPYLPGRASNGPVAVEYLAASLGVPLTPGLTGNNHAFIGAATSNVVGPFGGPPVDNTAELLLNQQLPIDTNLMSQVARVGAMSPDALMFVWAGANDIFINPLAEQVTLQAAINVAAAVNSLYDKGARRFLVPNLPDLGTIPDVNNDPTRQALLQLRTLQFNMLLGSLLHDVKMRDGINLIAFDTYAAFNALRSNPSAFGFVNIEDECFDGPPLNLDSVGGQVCNAPQSYLFWDGVHPSGRAHQLLGSPCAAAVNEQTVPEPATMVLTGLGAAALVFRRRRAA